MKKYILLLFLLNGALNALAQTAARPPSGRESQFIYQAGFEPVKAGFEEQLFYNLPATRSVLPPGMPQSPLNGYGSRVGMQTVFGPALLLKVDSGDRFDVSVLCFLPANAGSPQKQTLRELQQIAPLLLNWVQPGSGGKGQLIRSQKELLLHPGLLQPGITEKKIRPGASLNWILLDSALRPINGNAATGFLQNTKPGKPQTLAQNGITITQPGYFLVFLANESPVLPAFFDQLAVKHYQPANTTARLPCSNCIITEDNVEIVTENNTNIITEN